jgi:hypothetical protein
MAFNDLVIKAQTYFPNLQVKFKDQSTLMKVIGKICFFNPAFMTSFVTTIGNTIYMPNYAYTQTQAGTDVFIHEVVHLYDQKRFSFLYTLAYALPQLLFLPSLLLFLISYKLAIPVSLFFLLPIPAPWRTYFEKRAYSVQLYVYKQMWGNSLDELYTAADDLNKFFTGSTYYFMWPFSEDSSLRSVAANVSVGNDPMNDPALMIIVDALILAAKL